MYEYEARMTYVVDADTMDFEIDLGFNVKVDMRLRVRDLRAPEDETASGKIVESHVNLLFAFRGDKCRVRTKKTKNGEERDRYGRYVADVIFEDGSDLRSLVEQFMVDNDITDQGK